MKNILNKLVVLLLSGFALAACTEHTEYDDTGFSAVEKLLYPSDGYALDLIEQADANLYFEWEVSKVGTPVYTVVFLDAAKKEIGRYLADNNGQKSSLKMLHSQLNAIAGDAGIEPDAAGRPLLDGQRRTGRSRTAFARPSRTNSPSSAMLRSTRPTTST